MRGVADRRGMRIGDSRGVQRWKQRDGYEGEMLGGDLWKGECFRMNGMNGMNGTR